MAVSGDLRAQFDEDPWPVVGFLSAEHSSLTATRTATIAEGNARVSSYLTTVSASFIALGFVAGGSAGFDRSFFALSAALLGICGLIGLLTYRRCIQISIEDLHMLSRIERVRRTYLELVPGLVQCLDAPVVVSDDVRPIRSLYRSLHDRSTPYGSFPWKQALLTMAGLVGVVNSALLGAAAGCFLQATTEASVTSWVSAAVVLLGSLALHLLVQLRFMDVPWDRRIDPKVSSTGGRR